ncbi:hypothetical protein Tco_0868950, partial [Tanacetum coccineum]
TENAKIKQHYKELYDSIKITRAKHIDQTTALLTENENLKVQIKDKMKCVTMDSVKPKVLAPNMYAIDVEPLPPRCRNNREVHLDYLNHLKESIETLRKIIKEARVERPLDRSLAFAYLYTKHSQELLESKPRSNAKKNRILLAKSFHKKKVEDHPRTNKFNLKTMNHVDSSISSKRTVIVGSLDHSMYEAQDQWHKDLNNEELLLKENKERLQTLKMENNNGEAYLNLTKLGVFILIRIYL